MIFHSNSVLGNPGWRMIDSNVPIRSSRWSGTGTVMVLPAPNHLHDDVAASPPPDFCEPMLRKYFAGLPARQYAQPSQP